MMIRLIPLAMLIASPAFAQNDAVPVPPPPVAPAAPAPPKQVIVRVMMQTADGPILIELEKQRAPITTNNFLRYVDQKRFDGTSFYRAVKQQGAPGCGLAQGGVRYDPKKVLPPIAHEPTSKTGLSHTDATISMARNAPGTASGDFFITVCPMAYMDADPSQPGDNLGYAAFGHVVEGMDVVKKILASPTSPTAGAGLMKGQMLAPTVRILSVRRTK
jgi:peptidyl-prolyl cis-trans isomerase A (cyclophilin A)